MAQMSDYLENAISSHVLRGVTFASPGTVYLALYSSNPGEDDTGTELSGSGYVRIPVTFSTPVDGETSNAFELLFPAATADWAGVTHMSLCDDISGGNMLMYQTLDATVNILLNNNFRVPIGELEVTFA